MSGARAGGYEGMTDEQALRQLAAQVESVLSREGGDWLQLRRSLDQKTAGSAQSGDDWASQGRSSVAECQRLTMWQNSSAVFSVS